MRRIFLLCLCVLYFPGMAAPVLHVSDSIADFGLIHFTEPIELDHIFTMENTGDDTLVIDKIKEHCGCSHLAYTDTLAPGEEGTVEVSLNVRGTGSFNQSIVVFSNDADTPIKRLYMQARVVQSAMLENRYTHIPEDTARNSFTDTLYILAESVEFDVENVFYQKRTGDSLDIKLPVAFSLEESSLDPAFIISALADYISAKNTVLDSAGIDTAQNELYPLNEYDDSLQKYSLETKRDELLLDRTALMEDIDILINNTRLPLKRLLEKLRQKFPPGFTRYRLIYTIQKNVARVEGGILIIKTSGEDSPDLEATVSLESL
ncbi:MAG: DUF1573 domain-containing protein [Fibrobacterota bacterium]